MPPTKASLSVSEEPEPLESLSLPGVLPPQAGQGQGEGGEAHEERGELGEALPIRPIRHGRGAFSGRRGSALLAIA